TWHWRAHITNLLSREYMQLVRAHLSSGGVFFFNTTWSEDALVTALSTFAHGIRVWNCIAVSDGALDFDRPRWQALLTGCRIQNGPVLDLSAEHDRARLDELLAYVDTFAAPPTREGLESKESMLARFTAARVITDDNMVPEWRDDLSVQIA